MDEMRKLMETAGKLFEEDNSFSGLINNTLEQLDYYGARLSLLADKADRDGINEAAEQLRRAAQHIDEAIDEGVSARDYIQSYRGEDAPWAEDDYL